MLDIKSRAELREWLIQNHKTEKECWVVVKRGRPTDDNTFWYIYAVEEALCFGWIDSTTKKIVDDITAQKLCPRKPRSKWSELNKERCRRMERLGLMTDAGRAVLPDMSPNGFIIDERILQRLHLFQWCGITSVNSPTYISESELILSKSKRISLNFLKVA